MSAPLKDDAVIGKGFPRKELKRLVRGRGRYIADIKLPRMVHLAFVRSPHPHARIVDIRTEEALALPGVLGVYTGKDFVEGFVPLVGIARHRRGHKSAPQYPMAVDRAVWQGQPVAAVVAETRAEAEDAAELIQVEWEELPAIVSGEEAVAPDAKAIHPEIGDNLAFEHVISVNDPEKTLAQSHIVVEQSFRFERQTGLPLETRGLIADWNPGDESLTVHYAHQSPFQMQEIFSRHLGIPPLKVRVIAPDVGGGFGIKLNIYGEDIAVVMIAQRLGRPVKFISDRLESLVSDAHARDHDIVAKMGVSADGRITSMWVDDLGAVGAYGMQFRFNVAEGMMCITMAGACYDFSSYWARTRSVYVNKNLVGMYRGVGIPLACIVTELLADKAARKLGMDPAEFRRLNHRRKENLPCVTPNGSQLDSVSFEECFEKIMKLMDYDALRKEQSELRARGIWRGIGLASFVEATSYGPPYYGPSEAQISTQDGCTLRLEPAGVVRCITSLTDQGQGTLTGIAQIVAEAVGLSFDQVEVMGNDSAISPYGGGAWASRGMAVGGEAALNAGRALRDNIISLAAMITQNVPEALDIRAGEIVNKESGASVLSVAELGRIAYFRQDTLPKDADVQLSVTKSFADNHKPYYMANGIQASYVEVDEATGFIKLLGHWAVDDCGRVINPLQVDEQVRGGVVQGIGAVLYEEFMYSSAGGLQNGSLVDYLIPAAGEMPDIHVAHVETPERTTQLGAKGIGEAGLIGAMGALWVSVNDALHPLGATVAHQPFTPERVLSAIRAAKG